jgi:uncharacterized membrane protein
MGKACRFGVGLVVSLGALIGAAHAQQFIPIPPLLGDTEIYVRGVSGDGSIVIGVSGTYPDEHAFYWTAATGTVALEPDDLTSYAVAISADGSTIVGTVDNAGVRWVNGVVESLEGTEEYPLVLPTSVAADGATIAGRALPPQGPFGIPIRWTENGITDLGELTPDAYPNIAHGISDDAMVIVGLCEPQAFRWTEASGMVGLGFLPGFSDFSIATCVCGDGSVIGGQADIGFVDGYAATYWTESTGWVRIPTIISSASIADAVHGITADASIMVGLNTGFDPFERQVFIWDAMNGPRPLQEALENDYGVDFLGWQLAGLDPPFENEGDVMGIAADGSAIVGVTINPDTNTRWGWIVDLDSNPADVNGDGVVNVYDMLAVFAAWGETGDRPEDVNGDGIVNVLDLLALFDAWG